MPVKNEERCWGRPAASSSCFQQCWLTVSIDSVELLMAATQECSSPFRLFVIIPMWNFCPRMPEIHFGSYLTRWQRYFKGCSNNITPSFMYLWSFIHFKITNSGLKCFMECRGRAVECIRLKFWSSECGFESRPGQSQTLVSLSKMGRKAVGPVCCVMHVKEPRTLIVKEKGLATGVSGFAPWAPSRVRYISSVLVLLLLMKRGKQ